MTFTTVMTPKRPDTRRAASHGYTHQHRDIDQEIRKYEEAIRQLKSQRNTLALVAKLPPEILCKIFMFCATNGSTEYKGNLSWIKISHVFRYWREVALGCPNLWSSLVFTSASWAQEMLKRSKMAPLVIKADLTLMTPKMISAVQNALEHISRVTDLHFTAAGGPMDKLLGHLEQAAPLLQSLSISHTYPSYHYKNERYVFPETFLNGDAPKLEKLELVRCSIPWDSAIFHNLTHLKIFDTGAQFCPSLDQLVDALDMMSKLEYIELTDCLPLVEVDATSVAYPTRVVELPRLACIQLSSQTLECANVLNHISFPASTVVKLVCRGSDASNSDFSSLVPILTNWLDDSKYPSTQPRIQRLRVDHFNTNSIRFQAWNRGAGVSADLNSPIMLEMELSWKHFEAHVSERVISTICSALPLSHLRVLQVWQTEVLRSEAWVSTFGSLGQVRIVDVHGGSGSELVKALNVTSGGVLFPRLQSVVFDDVDFMIDRADEVTMVESFLDCLMLRSEYGVEIQELSIKRCTHITDWDVEALKEVVINVSWDGWGYGESEEDGVESDEEDLLYEGHGDFRGGFPLSDDEYYPL